MEHTTYVESKLQKALTVFVMSQKPNHLHISTYSANSSLGLFVHTEVVIIRSISAQTAFEWGLIRGSQSEQSYFTYIILSYILKGPYSIFSFCILFVCFLLRSINLYMTASHVGLRLYAIYVNELCSDWLPSIRPHSKNMRDWKDRKSGV